MNKYNIKDFLHEKLITHLSTLKLTSFDVSNDQYLCDDTSADFVYDFDGYVKENHDQSRLPASPDAILLGEKKLYFIEFKNQTPSKIEKNKLKDKFVKGTQILQELLKDFVPQDVEYIFCVVHQNERSRYFDARHFESMTARFGLEEKNAELGGFYSEVITENIDFYKSTFRQLEC